METIGGIEGLHWTQSFRISGGSDACSVPFPTMNPITVAFYGDRDHLDSEVFRAHVGVGHRLTFLGYRREPILGFFIDCRRSSATIRHRAMSVFTPDSTRVLHIPPGVAHCFHRMAGISVVDEFDLFLPSLDSLMADTSEWTSRGAALDFPFAASDAEIPILEADAHAASERLYEFVSHEILDSSRMVAHGPPLAEILQLRGGTEELVDSRVAPPLGPEIPDWEPIAGIQGAGWRRNLVMTPKASSRSGLILFGEPGVLLVVDHGTQAYWHSMYGIHVASEDRLTYLGGPDRWVRLKLADCRRGSPSLHAKIELQFQPSPFRHLVIPPGVAHALEDLDGVFTINRSKPYLDAEGKFPDDPTTINWPLDATDYPTVPLHDREPSRELYRHLVEGARRLVNAAGPKEGSGARSD